MASKLTGEMRIDMSSPVAATVLGELLDELDSQGIDRPSVTITLQPAVPHVGEFVRDPYAQPGKLGGMQLVATWDV